MSLVITMSNFTHCSSVFIVDIEQVNASWVAFLLFKQDSTKSSSSNGTAMIALLLFRNSKLLYFFV